MKRILFMMLILMPFASAVEDITGEFTKKGFNKSAIDANTSSHYGKECMMKDKSMYYNHMCGKKMMYGGMFGLLKLVYFAVIVFVFSIIFWSTHNWLVKKKK